MISSIKLKFIKSHNVIFSFDVELLYEILSRKSLVAIITNNLINLFLKSDVKRIVKYDHHENKSRLLVCFYNIFHINQS